METRSILIIEDENFISELYARALKKAGYSVVIMISGDDGLKAALSNEFDIILLDILVPGMSGMEVLEKIKNSNKKIKSQIIITTNLEQDDETKEKLEKIADGYLIKADMTPNELVEIIKSIDINKS